MAARAAPINGRVIYQEKNDRSNLFRLCHIVSDVTAWTDAPIIPKRIDNPMSLVSLSKDEGIKEVLTISLFRFLSIITYDIIFLIVVPLALLEIVLVLAVAAEIVDEAGADLLVDDNGVSTM